WVARAQRRRHEAFEQRDLVVRARPEGAQVARVDPVLAELRADRRDLDVRLGVELLGVALPRREEAEVLELARELRRDPCPRAQLGERQLRLGLVESALPSPAPGLRARRGELLPDHAERQELVALQPEDRLQPLDV